MPRHARQLSESCIYHVMLRGVNRDALFLEDEDRQRFLYALATTKQLSGCSVLAYCLMPNHVHLVLRTGVEPIGLVVKRLGIRYAGWFNRKYGRVGHLFQDRFRSQPVEDDAYVITLLRYVWRNPVQAGLAMRADEYPWSSYDPPGWASRMVDAGELAALLPQGALDDVRRSVLQPVADDESRGRSTPRHTDSEAAELLRQACGAESPDDFGVLPPTTRRRVIGELRTRSISYAQIATATGLSESAVRRTHLSAVPPFPPSASDAGFR